MKKLTIFVSLVLTIIFCSKLFAQKVEQSKQNSVTFNFDSFQKNTPPAGFFEAMTGKGKPGVWKVLEDSTAPSPNNVLAQIADYNFGYHFDMAITENTNFQDLDLTIKFKGVTGEEDQGGGPVWRYQDADNYYICRANPLENNFRVYKVVNGNRRMMKSVDIKVTSGEWHTIRVRNIGNEIECYYDGKLYLKAKDGTFSTGKIGVWAKADAVTYFDDIHAQILK